MRLEGLVIAGCLGLGTADLLALNLVLAPQLAGEPVGAPAALALVVAPPKTEEPPPMPTPTPTPPPTPTATPPGPVAVAEPVETPAPAATPKPPLGSIYFDKSLARLDSRARDAVDGLARELLAHPRWTVRVTGRTDASGSDEWNRELSERRAHMVAARLRADGVAASRIATEGVGSEGAGGDPESCRRADVAVQEGDE